MLPSRLYSKQALKMCRFFKKYPRSYQENWYISVKYSLILGWKEASKKRGHLVPLLFYNKF